jgi:hypothetical protein
MKTVVHGFHTQIFPTDEETKSLCKIGQGADTCIFLTIGVEGWECHALNRMPILPLIDRARRGETNAQREGCDRVLPYGTGGA